MPDCEFKDDVRKLSSALVNILAIVKHFQNKIKEWLSVQGLSTPSEEQVLEVVRKNYDLTLKLQDSLDHYERYAERPKHTAFFTNLVRDVVIDTRKNIYYSIKDVHQMPHDYSSPINQLSNSQWGWHNFYFHLCEHFAIFCYWKLNLMSAISSFTNTEIIFGIFFFFFLRLYGTCESISFSLLSAWDKFQ